MSERLRRVLLVLVVLACILARASGALGAQLRTHRAHLAHRAQRVHRVHAHRVQAHRLHAHHLRRTLSHATVLAREQARVVRFARRFIGVPYEYGGTSPSTGFDCSGFTRFVYAHFGISLPHFAAAQFDLGRRVGRGGLRPGDLVFFDGLGHVGLYIGGGLFIHAPHTGTRVQVSSLAGWYGAYDGARRIV